MFRLPEASVQSYDSYDSMPFSNNKHAAQNMIARLTLAEAAMQPIPSILSSMVRE